MTESFDANDEAGRIGEPMAVSANVADGTGVCFHGSPGIEDPHRNSSECQSLRPAVDDEAEVAEGVCTENQSTFQVLADEEFDVPGPRFGSQSQSKRNFDP